MAEPWTMRASDFKTHCLSLLDRVATTGEQVVVTKHGRPVARLVPLEDADERSIHGSVTLLAEDDEAYLSTGAVWAAERDPTGEPGGGPADDALAS